MKKRVFIAYTGGTIGMRRTPNGYAPAQGYLQEQMGQMPELWHDDMPEFVVYEFDPLLDSSNMTPSNWLMVARAIYENYASYDGFVVLHGTDTMAYTSSALPFFLQGLRKPVIVTGSQIPLCEVRNDARQNLIASLIIAAYSDIPEVCLCFGTYLFRGCRAVKVYSDGLDAFASPNYPPLAEIGTDITIFPERINRPDAGDPTHLQIAPLHMQAVGVLRLFPGISAEVVRNMLRPPLKGLVLETYGAGNAPDDNPEFLAAISQAVARGVVVVNCTQCIRGSVHAGAYETGSALSRAGVISGHDMTVEAALAKLFFLLSTEASTEDVKRRMEENLCGELSPIVAWESEQAIVLKGS
jgi:L-asparaginase